MHIEHIYLTWYYWYKNFWDELLLLWVLWYISTKHPTAKIYIQSDNVWRLEYWLASNNDIFHQVWQLDVNVYVVPSLPFFPSKWSHLVIGGWEVVTDARSFPYNWRTYFKYVFWIILGKYSLYGGIWTIEKFWSKLLYFLLLWRAEQIVVREQYSRDVAATYSDHVTLHHDFAYDALKLCSKINAIKNKKSYILINVNKHIRNQQTKSILLDTAKKYESHRIYFFPASVWVDDSDLSLLSDIQQIIPTIELYDWTKHSLLDTLVFVAWAQYAVAARLHIVLLIKYFDIPFLPLIYQEKISRILSS